MSLLWWHTYSKHGQYAKISFINQFMLCLASGAGGSDGELEGVLLGLWTSRINEFQHFISSDDCLLKVLFSRPAV